jgi:hypothetical protein
MVTAATTAAQGVLSHVTHISGVHQHTLNALICQLNGQPLVDCVQRRLGAPEAAQAARHTGAGTNAHVRPV